MPAYLIAEHVITDEAKFHEYRTRVEPMMAKHGGRYLTKGAAHKLPEGGHWKPERVVIIEFPDMNSLDAWYNSRRIARLPMAGIDFGQCRFPPPWTTFLLVDFDCAGGGRPTLFAGIRQVAQVRIV